jgi:hypothetical protein
MMNLSVSSGRVPGQFSISNQFINNPESEVSLADQLPRAEKVSNLIRWRRSVRRYKDENLTPELIDELL